MLSRTLAVNALSTGACAVVLGLFARPLAGVMGLDSPVPLWVTAALFLPYAVLMFAASRRPRAGETLFFVAADAAYVVACLALASWPGLLSGIGKELVLVSALLVGVCVVLQWRGLTRLRASAA